MKEAKRNIEDTVALPCGGYAKVSADPAAAEGGSGRREGDRAGFGKCRVVIQCARPCVEISGCPRMKEMRELLDARRNGKECKQNSPWMARLEGDILDIGIRMAHVDDADKNAVKAVRGDPAPAGDAEPDPVAKGGADGVVNAEGRADKGGGGRDGVRKGDLNFSHADIVPKAEPVREASFWLAERLERDIADVEIIQTLTLAILMAEGPGVGWFRAALAAIVLAVAVCLFAYNNRRIKREQGHED